MVSVAGVLWYISKLPVHRLHQVELEVNRLYGEARPFPYRWRDAPLSSSEIRCALPQGSASVPNSPLARVSVDLLVLRGQFTADPQWIHLAARISLLQRRYAEAVAEYRRAKLLGGRNIEGELATALALRAEFENRPSDYGAALEESAKSTSSPDATAVDHFNAALLMEKASLFQLSIGEWQKAIGGERNEAWRHEAQKRLGLVASQVSRRAASIEQLYHPETLDLTELRVPAALERVQQIAVEQWLSINPRPSKALHLLASEFQSTHGDLWWRDFLAARASNNSLALLSESQRQYAIGRFAMSETLALSAEREFSRLGNRAGRLRARWQRIVASHRGDNPSACPALLKGVAEEAQRQHWKWLLAQSWLDEITCRNLLFLGSTLDDRERVLDRVEALGYEGVILRALAFLTEPQVTAGSPLRVWTRGLDGINRFWHSNESAYRLHHFLWCLSEVARMSDEPNASALFAEESALNFDKESDSGLRTLVLGDLAAAQSRAGLFALSADTLKQVASFEAEGRSTITANYFYEIEVGRAQAETAAGDCVTAIRRIRSAMNKNADRQEPGTVARAELLNALGVALLQNKSYAAAAQTLEESIKINRRILNAPGSQLERESLTRLYETAFRGLIEARIRLGMPAESALAVWNSFRGRNGMSYADNASVFDSASATLTFARLPGGFSAWLSIGKKVEQQWVDYDQVGDCARKLTGLAADEGAPISAIRKLGRQIEALLLGRYESRLASASKLQTLLIDADDLLNRLPWAVLENPKGASLIERYSLVMLTGPSKRLHVPLISRASRAAIFADPDSGSMRFEFPPLPDAEAEGERVARLFSNGRTIKGVEATSAAFIELATKTNILHFAGHGVSNGGFGGLVVAGKPPFLTADQISSLDLSRLALVVLSACSTGLGPESGSVNADLLVRGFLDAGAARVMASSWDVDSVATRRLMEEFYASLLSGVTPSAALRQAMLALATNPSTSHPAEWAAFQLYGQP